MYLYKIMTYVDYDYFEYSYYQNEKKYTLEEILKFNEVMSGHAHNKDVNRAINAIDCLIYGIERDLDD